MNITVAPRRRRSKSTDDPLVLASRWRGYDEQLVTNASIGAGGAGGLGLAEIAHRAGGAAPAVVVAAFGAANLAQDARSAQQIRADLL